MTDKFLTSNQVVLRIITIISVVEFSIMDAFIFIHADISPYVEALLDIVLLVALATPLIYLWVINPYIKERDDLLDEMEQLMHKDLLTELPSRHEVYSQLENGVSASAGAVILLDMDGIKLVNDTFGHDAGDEVLIETAKRLRSIVSEGDIAGRLDGDEFVVLVKYENREQQNIRESVLTFSAQLIQVVSEPVKFNGEALIVSATIGIRLFEKEEINPDRAMHDADVALIQAKQRGEGSIVIFEK